MFQGEQFSLSSIARWKTGVFHVVYFDGDRNRIGSGSAFLARGHLITNGHAYDCPPETASVLIRQEQGISQIPSVQLSADESKRRRVVASPKEEYDYAALRLDELKSSSL